MEYLNAYRAAKVVAVGEDATRLISKVEYDSESNKLVGFVLPCNDKGLPLCDSFPAESFKRMEEAFRKSTIAKYAFVYMVQPLSEGVPAFCLACLGSDNKFCTNLILKRWEYIFSE